MAVLEKPRPRNNIRMVKDTLGLAEWELMGALGGISSKTLTNWLSNPKPAQKDDHFLFLLRLLDLSRDIIKKDRLADWIHEPQEEFGGLTPAQMLTREETRDRVLTLLRELRYGNLA